MWREFSQRKYRGVPGKVFDRFIDEYPRELSKHTIDFSTPMIIQYHDFSLGPIPLSLVAFRYEDESAGHILETEAKTKQVLQKWGTKL